MKIINPVLQVGIAVAAGWIVQNSQEPSGGYHLFTPEGVFQYTASDEYCAWITAARCEVNRQKVRLEETLGISE